MKRTGFIILGALVFACSAACQTQAQAGAQTSSSASAAPSAPADNPHLNASLADGSPIVAELSSSVDSKKIKQGDAVSARTTADIRADGKTIIPKGTKLIGHVTEAAARAKGGADSSLGIAFDKAILKGGEELPLNVAIVAVAPPPSSMPGQNMSNDAGPVASPGAPSNMGSTSRPGGAGATGGAPATSSSPTGPPVDSTTTSNGAPPEKGLDAAGRLTPNSRGVYGLKEASLRPATNNPAQGSVITSNGKNVHLDSDTQLLLVTQGRGTAPVAPKS
ncbi:MAG TPA: hypothetical protein VGF61_04485 [Candidatus Acidoferrum sp.]|jgi:hypothetical protein